ncbi:Swt1 family HEPN domain-containing protein [Microcystis aeruginosa CS-1036]|uniref:Swt1 family HEPN domain-containing protein n=1 Tax=Microcystis TaxID=1125 RepID=UPI002330A5BE|nr:MULTISPECIES: Swt1 family HEPN domain-containing protein [Microcystis]MDB9406771.1 Swt1 family HEPN domain-containing protein [Microcystis sp. CS-574]MDB9542612.1 Swt1 family HEPN domain-containing protein [Microcystis aeruginosa CS-1036]
MAISNRERVGRALDFLREGLYPFIEREMKASYGQKWVAVALSCLPENYTIRRTGDAVLKEDVSALLIVLWEQWNEVFKKTLGRSDRSLASELRDVRNAWAHNDAFSLDDAYRAFDSISRLLSSVSADTQEVEKQKQEILRLRFEEQARRETRRQAIAPTEGQPMSGLKPWREIATPHPDVASGRYQEAEFAADLWQVYLDQGSDEYRLPNEFFGRTYLTEGLKQLLTNALIRLTGAGGDPVIELQTNFGGGKTHAILALYHLFFGVETKDLPGMEPVLQAAAVNEPPKNVNTVVIVGNKLSPGRVEKKRDGVRVHTLWGEIAWQLGGKEGYEMVREADETATNPGDVLKELFNRYAPCLILIDEWVAYARQLHERADLPGGSFDTHFTFAQTLSESAKNADRTLLVVSIPSSDIEIGGERGTESLDRLKNAIGRIQSPWRPASAEESFEIVRRRLFQTTTDPQLFVARDAVIKAFSEMYRTQAQEFPSECREADYGRRLREAYPIHPEFFDRLYSDWSTLDKFQRTRGVLRLMAKVIHSLWERDDKSLLIMPAHVPMDDAQVQSELTRYLDDNWVPIIEKDVDGPNSLPLDIDRQNSNLGRYSACRRVTRTIYLGSAPTIRAANRGLEDKRIKLGCVQPGETVATFGDALRRLTDRATYLYIDGNRYWISNQPNVTRTAQDRANLLFEERYKVTEEIVRRLKADQQRGEFGAIHIAPESTADIPDDPHLGVRLVVLGPGQPHSKSAEDSPARRLVAEILNQRGGSPRYYKNTLVFVAPDKSNLENLEKNVAGYLAWNSIVADKETLNLDVSQNKQAITKRDQADKEVSLILNQTYKWLLVPEQPDPQKGIHWTDTNAQGDDSPIDRASRKLVHEEQLITHYSGDNLRREALDKYLWRSTNHIDLKRLWEYLAQYLYLPRLKNPDVLLQAVREGVRSTLVEENFGYAEGWDEAKQRYTGLVILRDINPSISSHILLVKPDVAMGQLEAEKPANPPTTAETDSVISSDPDRPLYLTSGVRLTAKESPDDLVEKKPVLRRFYGIVSIDPLRINRDAPAITNEVIQHLTRLSGARVKVTLEIEAEIPDGAPDDVVRTVTENCRTLKFNNQSFELE